MGKENLSVETPNSWKQSYLEDSLERPGIEGGRGRSQRRESLSPEPLEDVILMVHSLYVFVCVYGLAIIRYFVIDKEAVFWENSGHGHIRSDIQQDRGFVVVG